MFKLARDHFLRSGNRLASGFKRLREGGVGRLFVFEFAVVQLGVLVAQALANWNSERLEERRVEAAWARSQAELSNGINQAEQWNWLGPCLDRQLDRILATTARGGAVTSDDVERPLFYSSPFEPLSRQERLVARRVIGNYNVDAYEDIFADLLWLDEQVSYLSTAWSELAIIDESLGSPSARDLANARLAAARLKGSLRTIASVAPRFTEALDERFFTRRTPEWVEAAQARCALTAGDSTAAAD